MELGTEKATTKNSSDDKGTSLSEIQDWLEGWSTKRKALRALVMQRAEIDPTYSWLTAERELVLMDTVMQRLNSITNTLRRPVSAEEQADQRTEKAKSGKAGQQEKEG